MILFKWAWRGLRAVLLSLAAAVLLIEEWGWRPLSRWLARWAHWPPLARLEARIRSLSPRAALGLFLVPGVALFPVKLLALWLIHQGHAGLGLGTIIIVKLFGTALMGRLFTVTERQLMSFGWFARALGGWVQAKHRVMSTLRAWVRWPSTRRRIVATMRRLFGRRQGL
jgi:hypothetical protein